MISTLADRADSDTAIAAPLVTGIAAQPVVATRRSFDLRRVSRSGALLLGALGASFLVWLTIATALPHARQQARLQREFDRAVADGTAVVNAPVEPGTAVASIEIPAIDVEEIVVEGTTADRLAEGPGHLRTSALPGQPGISILLGRRVAYGGPFADLDELDPGDDIVVTTGQGVIRYAVTSVAVHDAADASGFASDGDALILVTSDPSLLASRRLIVHAVPDEALFAAGTRIAQAPVAPDELGLGGDSSAAVGLLIWLQLTVVAAVGALVLFRRWRRWPGWVIAVPVVFACAWRMFEQLTSLLPATL